MVAQHRFGGHARTKCKVLLVCLCGPDGDVVRGDAVSVIAVRQVQLLFGDGEDEGDGHMLWWPLRQMKRRRLTAGHEAEPRHGDGISASRSILRETSTAAQRGSAIDADGEFP